MKHDNEWLNSFSSEEAEKIRTAAANIFQSRRTLQAINSNWTEKDIDDVITLMQGAGIINKDGLTPEKYASMEECIENWAVKK